MSVAAPVGSGAHAAGDLTGDRRCCGSVAAPSSGAPSACPHSASRESGPESWNAKISRDGRSCRASWRRSPPVPFRSASSQTTQAAAANGLSFLSPLEAADIDAVTAQIVPTDDTPGAREAGVMQFIDRALGTFLSHLAGDYRAQLAEFQSAFRVRYPDAASFASLASDAQIAYLKTVDRTPFFEATRLLTLLGMFTMPGVRRQPRRRRLDADWLRRAAYVPAALWLLRSRLSRLHGRARPLEMSARRYRDSDTVDFVIVGSGAAGGVMARELSRAGLSVVVLEQGPRLQPGALEHDELKYWFLGGITNDAVTNPQTFRSDAAQTARPTRRQAAALVRTRRGRRHAALHGQLLALSRDRFHRAQRASARSPGPAFDDWPITYAELEPYYTKVEWEIGVSGLAGASPSIRRARKPLSDAAAAGEVVGRAPRARRAEAGPPSVSRADGDQSRSRIAAGRPAFIAASATASAAR